MATSIRKATKSIRATMPGAPDQHESTRVAAQRRRVVRMALVLGAVALVIYIAFILSGVLAA